MESQTAQQVLSPEQDTTASYNGEHVVEAKEGARGTVSHVIARSDRAIQLTINVKQIKKLDKY